MNAPWKIYRYCGREILTLFLLTWISLTLLYVIVLGLQAVNFGFSMSIVVVWVFDSIEFSFYFTVPISLLLSATLGLGRWVSDREFTAITACGISPLHLGVPLLAITSVFGIAALATQGTWLPDAHYSQRNVARFLVQTLDDLGDRRNGQLRLGNDGQVLDYAEVQNGRHFSDIHLQTHFEIEPEETTNSGEDGEADRPAEPKRVPVILSAEFADLRVDEEKKELVLVLKGVDIKINDPSSERLFKNSDKYRRLWQSATIDEYPIRFPLEAKRKREGDIRSAQLLIDVEEIRKKQQTDTKRREYWIEQEKEYLSEYWRRIALALSVFSFALLGFPIPLAFRYQHRLFGLGVGTGIVISVFYPLLFLGETLCKSGVPAPIAMLAGNVAIIVIALGFIGRLLTR